MAQMVTGCAGADGEKEGAWVTIQLWVKQLQQRREKGERDCMQAMLQDRRGKVRKERQQRELEKQEQELQRLEEKEGRQREEEQRREEPEEEEDCREATVQLTSFGLGSTALKHRERNRQFSTHKRSVRVVHKGDD